MKVNLAMAGLVSLGSCLGLPTSFHEHQETLVCDDSNTCVKELRSEDPEGALNVAEAAKNAINAMNTYNEKAGR